MHKLPAPNRNQDMQDFAPKSARWQIQSSNPVHLERRFIERISWQMFKTFLKNLDPGSLVVVALTFVLFLIALFVQGFTHDVLLETAVFLVSLKLIIMAHKQAVHTKTMEQRLDQIHQAIRSNNAAGGDDLTPGGTPRV